MHNSLRYIKWLLAVLLVCLPFVSVQPVQQNLSAIDAASTMTLQGQQIAKAAATDAPQTTNEERTESTSPEQEKQREIEQTQIEPVRHDAEPKQQQTPNNSTTMQQQQTPNTPATTQPTANTANTSSPIAPQATLPNDAPITDDSPNIIVQDDAKDAEAYFETNVYDGQTVTTADYVVAITHVNDTLTVQETVVTLNDVVLANFNGDVTFAEDDNTLHIAVTYRDAQDNVVQVAATYTITLNMSDVVISTSLTNDTTLDDTYRFSANAMRAGEKVALAVTINGEALMARAGNTYRADLQIGDNTIVLRAGDTEETYTVTRTAEDTTIVIHTDLVDQKVSVPTFAFTARAIQNDDDIHVSVQFNEETLETASSYNVTLQAGTNKIVLHATDGKEVVTEQYNILYADPTITEQKPVDVLAPTLKTDLVDGTHVKGLIKTINIWATTADGTRIRGKDVAVKINGVGVPFVWDDSEKTSYKLTLQHGDNVIDIRAWDAEGRVVKETFHVSAEDVNGGVIGQATISVEGSVLGIPYFIPPTKVDIRQGERGTYVLDQLLRQYGYTYRSTGTLDSNFYLASIQKENMLQNVRIPDELWTLVEQASTRASKEDYSLHSLGEFDFANGAGWMFSVNGDYPNYGFSDAYFLDGDVVRIRFTLHYGRDIGGFGANGVGENANETGNNWEKEW